MNFFRQTPPALASVGETSGLLASNPPTMDNEVDEEYPAPNDLVEDCRDQQQSHLDSTDPYKLWLEINAERHSAERYVNNYLNALAKTCLFPNEDASSETDSDADVQSEGNPDDVSSKDIANWQPPSEVIPRSAEHLTILMKIYRDTVLRDLRNLETLLAFTKIFRESQPDRAPKPSPTTAVWTVACTVTAVALPIKVTAGLPFFGAFAGAAALAGPPTWRLFNDRIFESIRADVTRLRHAFEDDLGAIDDRSRKLLKKKRFRYLKYELTGLFEF